jgi:acyl-CoA thioesterase FadM
VHLELGGKTIGWPRVAVSCEYKSPVRFGDLLELHLSVRRKGERSMTYGFRLSVGGREVAVGESTSVCCELEPGREVRAIPIPDFIADKIEQAPR